MSALDRDKARAWLITQFGLPNLPDEIGEAELDALEECVLPAFDGHMFPTVAGTCSACGRASLFLGSGGHVTCARIDCPDPTCIDDLLNDRAKS